MTFDFDFLDFSIFQNLQQYNDITNITKLTTAWRPITVQDILRSEYHFVLLHTVLHLHVKIACQNFYQKNTRILELDKLKNVMDSYG